MLASLFNLSVVLEWITLIAALLLLTKKTGVWRLFILFLLLTICVETAGWFMHYIAGINNNRLLFNVFNIIANSFCIWMLGNAIQLVGARRKINMAITIFSLFGVLNLFVQFFWFRNSYAEELGNILGVYISCHFFYVVLKSDEHIDLLENEYFWFAIGLLFDSLGSMAADLFYNTLANVAAKTHVPVYTDIMNTLNVLFYGCLIVAFVCRRKNSR